MHLDTTAEKGARIAMYWKVLIFLAMFVSFYGSIEFWRRKPFLSFYMITSFLCTLMVFVIMTRSFDYCLKTMLLIIPFVFISLWRISNITHDEFRDYFSSSRLKLNRVVHEKVYGKMSPKYLEYMMAIFLFLNILWAVLIDFLYGSYWNAASGFILGMTIPIPPSLYQRFSDATQQYCIETRVSPDGKYYTDFLVRLYWPWIAVYTTWNTAFSMIYTVSIFMTLCHLYPCTLYILWNPNRRLEPTLYIMARCVDLTLAAAVFGPWDVFDKYIWGEPLIVQDAVVFTNWGLVNFVLALVWTVYYMYLIYQSRKNKPQQDEDKDEDQLGTKQLQQTNGMGTKQTKIHMDSMSGSSVDPFM